ncbi:MAG: hypothetical protein ACRDRH_22040 [Pseudonocardia sp.]
MTAAVDMTQFRVRGPLNRRSVVRFTEFWAALQQVGDALAEVEKLGARAEDAQRARASSGINGRSWSAATPGEIRGAAKKAHAALRVIAASAKRWEADLLSCEWRSSARTSSARVQTFFSCSSTRASPPQTDRSAGADEF